MIYQRRNGVSALCNAIMHARLSERRGARNDSRPSPLHFSLPTISLTRNRCTRRGDNAKKAGTSDGGMARFFMEISAHFTQFTLRSVSPSLK